MLQHYIGKVAISVGRTCRDLCVYFTNVTYFSTHSYRLVVQINKCIHTYMYTTYTVCILFRAKLCRACNLFGFCLAYIVITMTI